MSARFAGTPAALAAQAPPGWAPDPRLWQLGLRAVLPAEASSSAGSSGGSGGEPSSGGGSSEQVSSSSSSSGVSSSGWQEHRRWRMLFGVAEGDSEIPSGERGRARARQAACKAFHQRGLRVLRLPLRLLLLSIQLPASDILPSSPCVPIFFSPLTL